MGLLLSVKTSPLWEMGENSWWSFPREVLRVSLDKRGLGLIVLKLGPAIGTVNLIFLVF